MSDSRFSPAYAADTAVQATGLRTYLVEDSPIIRDNLLSMLDELVGIQAMGYAECEQDGRDWLRAHPDAWDLAIVDIFLKQGNGFGVLEACRNRQPGQKMVVLSNYATPEVRRRCAQLGVDGVFDKGTGIDDLVDYCQELRVAAT